MTDEERASLTKQHKKERDGRVRDRIKAVLLRDKGWTWMQIAEALLLSEEMLRKHLEDYKISKKLKPENGGSKEKLSFEQSQKLIAHLQSYTYLYTKDIAAYVESVFGIIYSVSGMCYWLKRNNFSYKKPSLVPGKANKEIQEACIAEYFKWVSKFVSWYNYQHLHSGIKFVAPIQRHQGDEEEILRQRTEVYFKAKNANPNRWSKEIRDWSGIEKVLLNPEKCKNALNQLQVAV